MVWAKQRKLSAVPRSVLYLFALFLAVQISFYLSRTPLQAQAKQLPYPPSLSSLQISALGEPIALAKSLMLWLQAFDNQPGVSISFHELDYDVVKSWLDSILSLDPKGQYPLLSASRVYAEVTDEAKQRIMLDFVEQRFQQDPARRWPWLAHAVVLAKHRLNDEQLALKFAHELADSKIKQGIPNWARQMEVFILEDMGELEAAQILIGGLLESGAVTNTNEIHFLKKRLEQLAARQSKPNNQ